MFCLIKPTKENLSIYERWLGHQNQESILLAHIIPNPQDVITVTLQVTQTLFIPTGWIHAVYTPEDSVVLGGNFLHGFNIPIQLQISEIEERTRVPQRFRFPYFRKVHFFTAGVYLKKLRDNNQGITEVERGNLPHLIRALEKWYAEAYDDSAINDQQKGRDVVEAALYAAKLNGCDTVRDLLQAMWKEYGGTGHAGGEDVASNSGRKVKTGLTIRLTDIPIHPRADSGLASPKSPKIRLSMKPANHLSRNAVNSTISGEPKDDKPGESLRIVISSVAKELHKPLPRVKRNPRTERLREDVEFVDFDREDDDWVPSASRRRQTEQGAGSKRKGGNAKACPVARTANTHVHRQWAPAQKKPKTTARQRLLKKFR